MRFWDSSAVLPLCLEEPHSGQMESLINDDPHLVVWWGTVVECASAVARLRREGHLDTYQESQVNGVLRALAGEWTEIQPNEELRRSGTRLLRHHPLRAADALQLAAAEIWTGGRPEGFSLVSLDHRLREAGAVEGFLILP